MKSLVVAYLLWLVGGLFGVHHFYLGRDLQGLVWGLSLGGCMGAGWLRDLFMIPGYVKQANGDPEYYARLAERMRKHGKPPFSSVRFGAMLTMGYLLAAVAGSAVPKEEVLGLDWGWLTHLLVPTATAIGVWAIGNIGNERGSFFWPLVAAYVSYPVYRHYDGEVSFTVMVICSAWAFDTWSKEWRRSVRPGQSLVRRTTVVSTCVLLYFALWGCSLYFNGTITDADGEEIPIREALQYFFTSPWWTDLWPSLVDTYNHARAHGWVELWKMVVELSDPRGEYNALAVLGLDSAANQTLINSRCRQLSMKYHPDKAKEPDLRIEAQEKFYQVQQACEILSTNKAKRRKNSKRSAA